VADLDQNLVDDSDSQDSSPAAPLTDKAPVIAASDSADLDSELNDQQLAQLRAQGNSDTFIKNNASGKWFNPQDPDQQDNALLDALDRDPSLLKQYDKFTPEEKESVKRMNLLKDVPAAANAVSPTDLLSLVKSQNIAGGSNDIGQPFEPGAPQTLLNLLNKNVSDQTQQAINAPVTSPPMAGPQVHPYTLNLGTGELGTNANLQAAQQLANQARLTNQLGGAASLIGAGFAHAQDQGQKVFEDQAKQSDQVTQNFLQQVAMQKNDPSSPISKAFRDYAKQFGVTIQGDFSAADGEQLLPMIFKGYEADQARQARSEDLKYKYDSLASQKQQHDETISAIKDQNRQDALNKQQQINVIKLTQEQDKAEGGKGAYSQPKKLIQQVDRLQQLYNQYPDINSMPSAQVAEFSNIYNNLASGGQGSDVKFKKLIPDTAMGTGAKLVQWFTNQPISAGQGSFIQQFMNSANLQKDVANKQIKEGLIKNGLGFESNVPSDELEGYYSRNGISPEEVETVRSGKRLVQDSAAKDLQNLTPKQQTQIQQFLQANPNITSQAEAYKALKDAGYKSFQDNNSGQ
jgi:hypothetical protein